MGNSAPFSQRAVDRNIANRADWTFRFALRERDPRQFALELARHFLGFRDGRLDADTFCFKPRPLCPGALMFPPGGIDARSGLAGGQFRGRRETVLRCLAHLLDGQRAVREGFR